MGIEAWESRVMNATSVKRGSKTVLKLRHPDHDSSVVEAGIDEAGRGALAGPVVAAAVIWNPDLLVNSEDSEMRRLIEQIRDSKKLSPAKRTELAAFIRENAVDWAVCRVDAGDIDRINIWNATLKAMHGALDMLRVDFDHILVDGNRFKPYIHPGHDEDGGFVPHTCVVRGDDEYVCIAAASILAKVTRDDIMIGELNPLHPEYDWETNKGYGTSSHIDVLKRLGPSSVHRNTFLRKMA